jgi:two-component system sensor histidine kinase VicK
MACVITELARRFIVYGRQTSISPLCLRHLVSLNWRPVKESEDIHSILARIVSAFDDPTLNFPIEGIILSNIINFSDDGIISTTLSGSITSWNKGAEHLYGYDRKEAMGKNVSMLIPADRQNEEPEIIQQIKAGKYVEHYDTVRLKKDGTLIDISLTVSPLKDVSGKIIGVSKIARDISSRKKLEEVQARLTGIINHSEDAIISKTLNGEITSWNRGAERVFGYISEEVIGKSITILFPPDRLEEETFILGKIKKGELVEHYESERVRKDGTVINISLTISPIRDAYGNIIGVSKIARDVTEKKKKEEELKRKNQELEAFTYTVSHDLRAPLRKIANYAQVIGEKLDGFADAEVRKALAQIAKSTQKMRNLIDDLLALSQISQTELKKTNIDINKLLVEVIDEVVSDDNSRIEIQCTNLVNACGDEGLLRQVFENLLSNAIKYSQKSERQIIKIGSEKVDGITTFHVADNGVGFDMKYVDRLFTVFQRLHSQTEFEGTGVGLAIVQQIILKHGGRLWATSEPNKGATFYFSLPDR